jgi:Mrp family chromosome partitioning ATPase
VLAGGLDLERAMVATPIAGLDYLSVGTVNDALPHPMAGRAFAGLLDRLAATHRFVIVELPDLEARPEGRSVIGMVDAAELVVRQGATAKASVRDAIMTIRTSETQLLGAVMQPSVEAGDRARPSPDRSQESAI